MSDKHNVFANFVTRRGVDQINVSSDQRTDRSRTLKRINVSWAIPFMFFQIHFFQLLHIYLYILPLQAHWRRSSPAETCWSVHHTPLVKSLKLGFDALLNLMIYRFLLNGLNGDWYHRTLWNVKLNSFVCHSIALILPRISILRC